MNPKVHVAISYVEDNLHRDIYVAEVAGLVTLSRSRFCHVFKSEVGNAWRVFCVSVFVFGAVSLFVAQKRAAGFQVATQSIDMSDAESAQAFVVEYIDSDVSPDGTVTVTGSSTRYVRVDGEWRLLIRRNNGKAVSSEGSKEAAVYAGIPDGVFSTKGNSATRRYVSPSSGQSILQLYRSGNYLRSHPEFVRTDQVANLTVYVFRVVDPANPGQQWREVSYSPKTGLAALRSVIHMSDGSEIRQEAVSVEFKDVPEDLNQDLKSLPIALKGIEPLNEPDLPLDRVLDRGR